MSATETEYVPRLKQRYNEELRGSLKDELSKTTVMRLSSSCARVRPS